jgi:hypothetical protein
MATYSEKLKDPRWQKKRLEILQRDNWTCQLCGATTITLHIHHRKYIKGKEPWEYPDHLLVTLCEICHDGEGESALQNQKVLIDQLLEAGVYNSEMDFYGQVIRLGIDNMGYENFKFLLAHIAIWDEFRNDIEVAIEKHRRCINSLSENPNNGENKND